MTILIFHCRVTLRVEMAHPYSSNPMYAGTSSYAPHQPYYPPFQVPHHGMQQPIHTPPGMPQQGVQPHPSYQPSPSTSAPRFDTHPQLRPPAPPFPQFPPATSFGNNFFKQFPTSGLPPPPLPFPPPVPLPSTYQQLPRAVNPPISSPYPPQSAPGTQGFASGFSATEPAHQRLPDSFGGLQPGIRDGKEQRILNETYPQIYGGFNSAQVESSHAARPGSRSVDFDKGMSGKTVGSLFSNTFQDQSLPSFGSRSDLELLFATAQKQALPVADYTMGNTTSNVEAARSSHPRSEEDGNVSPYDPARPAPVHDSARSGFGASNDSSRPKIAKPFERTYDNKSLAELRQLAKGALLSLVPHKIVYADLLKEGVNPQVLQSLYGELGLKTDPVPTNAHAEVREQPPLSHVLETLKASPPVLAQKQIHQGGVLEPPPLPSSGTTPDELPRNETRPVPALLDAPKQQAAPSPSLERKDRIAQLLAAKTGRPNPAPASTAIATHKDDTSTSVPDIKSTETAGSHALASPSPSQTQQDPDGAQEVQKAPKSKAQSELVKARMEQLMREAAAKAEAETSKDIPTALTVSRSPTATAAANVAPQFGQTTPLSTNLPQSYIGQLSATSVIPGLFMTSTLPSGQDEAAASVPEDTEMGGTSAHEPIDTLSAPATILRTSSTPTVPLKRPLASDFSSVGAEPQNKRPHTQDESQPVNSSAGENDTTDEFSEGEIVEEPGLIATPTASKSDPRRVREEHGSAFASQAAPVVDRKNRSEQTRVFSLQNNSANDSGSGGLYRAKQTEIESMRRKIAEMEQRNKLKRTQSQSESTVVSDPSIPPTSSPPAIPNPRSNSLNSSPSLSQRQPITPRTISKLTPAQLAERAATLKADLLRARTQRQRVLQEGLPDLNLEVSKTQSRLDKARNELTRVKTEAENYRAGLERSIKLETDLVEEVAQLEKHLQEGRCGQKQVTDELQQIKLDNLAEKQESLSQARTGAITQTRTETGTSGPPLIESNKSNGASGAASISVSRDQSPTIPVLSSVSDDRPAAEQTSVGFGKEAFEIEIPGNAESQPPLQEQPKQQRGSEDAPHTDLLPTAEMEISPEPEPTFQQMTPAVSDSRRPSNDTSMNMDGDSEGSASMSDSGSDEEDEEVYEEDYEPSSDNIRRHSRASPADSDEYDPEEAPVEDLTPTTGGEDEEFYEPSEVLDATERPSSHASPEETVPVTETVSAVPTDTRQDDVESGPQLTEADQLLQEGLPDRDTEDSLFLDGSAPSVVRFVPYKTPLSAFKTYRFHAAFNDTVKHGYRSLTYSNNIDPSRPLCPTELNGEMCMDPRCEEQHFGQLGLPGELRNIHSLCDCAVQSSW